MCLGGEDGDWLETTNVECMLHIVQCICIYWYWYILCALNMSPYKCQIDVELCTGHSFLLISTTQFHFHRAVCKAVYSFLSPVFLSCVAYCVWLAADWKGGKSVRYRVFVEQPTTKSFPLKVLRIHLKTIRDA